MNIDLETLNKLTEEKPEYAREEVLNLTGELLKGAQTAPGWGQAGQMTVLIRAACYYIEKTGDAGILRETCGKMPGQDKVCNLLYCLYDGFHLISREECRPDPGRAESADTFRCQARDYIEACSSYSRLCTALDEDKDFRYMTSGAASVSLRSQCMKPTSSAGAGPRTGSEKFLSYGNEAKLAAREVSAMQQMFKSLDEPSDGIPPQEEGKAALDDKVYCLKFGLSGMDRRDVSSRPDTGQDDTEDV